MKTPLLFRVFLRVLLVAGLSYGGLFRSGTVCAQCLPAAACTPGNAPTGNLAFGMGIFRVTLAGLDTTTNGAAEGYQDYSCRGRATQLVRGTTYTLAVRTNTNADESVRAWVDFDGNGQFSVGELVLSSTAARQHQGSFTVPATALTNQPLRLRIAADYANAPVPTACSTPQYSQTEDYRVLVTTAALPPPIAAFGAPDSVTCSGIVHFADRSRNAPTAWRWSFGDGTTSTAAAPVHTYAAAGSYPVRLRVCNANGCDTLARAAFVLVRGDGPRPMACQPATTAYCCGFGLARVRLPGLDHRPGGGSAGYQDASCTNRATLRADWADTLRITTSGPGAHDVRVYLDLNDDGQFGAGELLYQGQSIISPTAVLAVPATAPGLVYNKALRLRVWADYAGSSGTGPCAAPERGQVADYSVVVLPNNLAPHAALAVAYAQPCGPLRVNLRSTGRGALSYAWDFGDGTTGTGAVPPVHTYATPGLYTVQLVASNLAGRDTVRQDLAAAEVCPTSYCVVPGWGGNADTPLYLSRVKVADLDNDDTRAPGVGYRDFTARVATVRQGQAVALRAEMLPWIWGGGPSDLTAVWADFNHDGDFGTNELLAQGSGFSPHLLTLHIPLNARPGATRLRVMVYEYQRVLSLNGCMPANFLGAFEDYTLMVLPARGIPQAGFVADLRASCSGQVQFTDTTTAGPRAWAWSFGDGTSATVQHPHHTYAAPGTYTVSLHATNPYGTSTVTRTGYIVVAGIGQGPRPVTVQFPSWFPPMQRGVAGLQLGSLAYTDTVGQLGYSDETCRQPALHLSAGTTYPFTVGRLLGIASQAVYGYLWLDANDDGRFTTSELLFASPHEIVYPTQQGSITLPTMATVVGNRPLRLRLRLLGMFTSAPGPLPIPDAQQHNEEYDQIRDFTVWVSGGTLAAAGPKTPVDWTVYPNPTTGQLTLSGVPHAQLVSVSNLLGQIVATYWVQPTAGGSGTLTLQGLAAGTYFIQLPSSKNRQRIVLE